jgi:YVTN family beta-propeller protein
MKPLIGLPQAISVAAAVLLIQSLPAAAQDRMYIPLGGAGEVIVVDTAGDAVAERIPGLPAVHGLAGTPDGRFLIAGSFEEREACCAPPAKPAAVSEDEHAAHHAKPGEDNRTASPVVSTLSVVRTEDRSVIRRIDVPGAVHHVAVSPDGGLAVVTQPNQDRVSAIDLRSYEVVATLPTGSLPNHAVFSPDGSRVYVSNAGNGTVSEVDTARWIVRRNVIVGAGPEHVVLGNEGTRLYVNNVEAGTVSVISTGDGKVIQTLPIGATLHGIDISDDGTTLFVAAMGDDKLVGVDLATGTYRSVFLSPEPYHLTAVRGTGKLYISSADQPKVWVADQRDLKILGEIPIGGKGHQMVQGSGS